MIIIANGIRRRRMTVQNNTHRRRVLGRFDLDSFRMYDIGITGAARTRIKYDRENLLIRILLLSRKRYGSDTRSGYYSRAIITVTRFFFFTILPAKRVRTPAETCCFLLARLPPPPPPIRWSTRRVRINRHEPIAQRRQKRRFGFSSF